MKKVLILKTPGCPSCARVENVLEKYNIKYENIDVTKRPNILKKYPIMAAPGIVINGKLEFTGVPKEGELKEKLGIK